MAVNYKSINYGLPGRYTKLPIRKVSTKKTVYSKCMYKNVELFNPVPMPYQKDLFKPCTVSRFVDIPRRMNDGFTSIDDLTTHKQRGIILHKDRYDWNGKKDVISNQNERLAAEENYQKKVKFLKRFSEQKLKSSTHNLVLEGENVLPVNNSEKTELKKSSQVSDDDHFRHPAPTMITNYEDSLEHINTQQPVSIDVYGIKLKTRQMDGEHINSAPAHSPSGPNYLDNIPNMYVDRLPPIHGKQKEFNQSFPSQTDYHQDFGDSFRQSERFNRPNVRLNEYVVDGTPVKFTERADIQGELRCLKSLTLPTTARDLFIGRGINLPSTHATKNPRGRYSDDSTIPRNQMDSTVTIETAGGGSVTINTTPSNENNRSESTLVIGTEPLAENINVTSTDQREAWNISKDQELNCEEIVNFLSPDENGLISASNFIAYITDIGSLQDHEKRLVIEIVRSVDTATRDQVMSLLQTIKIIINSNPTFRSSLMSIDFDRIKSLIPQLLISMDSSKGPINVTTFYQFLVESISFQLTEDQFKEIYSNFQKTIESDEKSNENEIIQSHILLLIIFLLLQT